MGPKPTRRPPMPGTIANGATIPPPVRSANGLTRFFRRPSSAARRGP